MNVDLLATPTAQLGRLLGSAARGEALRRHITAEPRNALGAKVAGVAATALDGLRADAWLATGEIVSTATAPDGTTKWALRLHDRAEIETVLIPSTTRATVCVSSQSGCTRRCAFCATATLGFKRNLRAGEIVFQYLVAAQAARSMHLDPRNVVFMGMGEPLDNFDEVLKAVVSLTDTFPGLSPRHVTVSTSGVAPRIEKFLERTNASLALSLNATTDEIRTRVMPHNKTWPLNAIFGVLREAALKDPKRRTFVEYVQLPGVNDAPLDAERLARLLRGLNVHVNVIPHNPFPASPFRAPSREETLRFHAQVKSHGLKGIVRWPRGNNIAGACGQLALQDVSSKTGETE